MRILISKPNLHLILMVTSQKQINHIYSRIDPQDKDEHTFNQFKSRCLVLNVSEISG